MKIHDGGGHHIEFRKMSISGLNENISTKCDGQMHNGHGDVMIIATVQENGYSKPRDKKNRIMPLNST